MPRSGTSEASTTERVSRSEGHPWRTRGALMASAATGARRYFFFEGRCESALAAADFDAALVRPSPSTFDAALPALAEVLFFDAPVCESALPAAFLEAAPVDPLRSVFDAADAALLPVVFPLAIATLSSEGDVQPQTPTPDQSSLRARTAGYITRYAPR